ncbi:hypothetical protein [Kitasatospora sp. NPDC058046]|uniref:hypothetical protein n=1 Tax=Kitasatospora sp. NPDC058046 TaxID=3346312 RepID=UPI0036DC003F
MGALNDRTDALTDVVCGLAERVAAHGWSPSAATDTLDGVDALLDLLGQLGPEAAAVPEPALAASAQGTIHGDRGALPPAIELAGPLPVPSAASSA